MEPFPTLRTERLVLREFTLEDAPELRRLAGAREVARTMLHHPHPYEADTAEEWISGLRPMFEAGKGTTFALVLRQGGTLVGTASLYVRAPDGTAVLARRGRACWGSGSACRTGTGATPPRGLRRWCGTASRGAA